MFSMMEGITPQMIGLIAGVVVFCCTVVVTFVLLIVGGSFKRMREQAETYNSVGSGALKQALKPRPELYDELLEAAHTLPKVPAVPTGGIGHAVAGELRGYHVILRALDVAEHAQRLFEISNGSPTLGHAYDSDLGLWKFSPYGPFGSVEELISSPLMQPLDDGLRFVVIDAETRSIIGMAAILANEPSCLRAAIGDVWLNPAYRESRAVHELHFLLLGHLFKMGYRRVERRVDAGDMDARIALPVIGFHLEGVLRKHMIVKACNRDTAMFSMLNAEWRDRAKDALEKFLASDSGATSKRARAQAASKAAAADVAGVPEGGSQKKNA